LPPKLTSGHGKRKGRIKDFAPALSGAFLIENDARELRHVLKCATANQCALAN